MQYSKALRRPGCAAIVAMAIILLLVYLLFGRNLYMSGAPQAVTDVAMDQLVETCIKDYNDNCSDFRIIRAQEKTLPDADRADGIDAAWCMELSLSTHGSYGRDTQHIFVDVSRSNGELTALKSGAPASNLSVRAWDASREKLWNACLGQ